MATASARNLASYHCPLCEHIGRSIPLVLSHIRAVHSHDPNFLVCCGIESCCYTAKTFSALYSHVYRRHSSIINRRTSTTLSTQPPGAAPRTGMIMSTAETFRNIMESSSDLEGMPS